MAFQLHGSPPFALPAADMADRVRRSQRAASRKLDHFDDGVNRASHGPAVHAPVRKQVHGTRWDSSIRCDREV
jgi:hypothetical protein